MKYTVRSKEGELEYLSFGQVEHAWLMGLIEPDDEILEEGKTKWRKAGTIPLLAQARRKGDAVWQGTWFVWVLAGVIGGTVALYQFNEGNYIVGFVIAFGVASVMLHVTWRAYQKEKPHR
jgi:hypothetical protein